MLTAGNMFHIYNRANGSEDLFREEKITRSFFRNCMSILFRLQKFLPGVFWLIISI